MRSIPMLLVLLFSVICIESARDYGGRWGTRRMSNRKRQMRTVSDDNKNLLNETQVHFDQVLDHFNDSDTRTYRQRYCWSERNREKNTSNINFLEIAGEWAAYCDIHDGVPMVKYAEKFGARVYELEHRYYGQSDPFKNNENASTEFYKFLSSRQAIKDIETFIEMINAQSERPSEQKWIVFGCSYAGTLAAWARQKLPHLITGAIASSAPMEAQLDFYGYYEMVERNIAEYPQCYSQIDESIREIEQLLISKEGRKELDRVFNFTPKLTSFEVIDNNEIVNLYNSIMEPFAESSQYESIWNICHRITNCTTGMSTLERFGKLIKEEFGKIDIRYREGYSVGGDPSWYYQTCTEFGFYETTDRGSNLFRSALPLSIHLDACKDIFGIGIDEIQKSIADTNEYYGGRDYFDGTNIVFTHAGTDPWSYLGMKPEHIHHPSVVTITIEGSAHCFDITKDCTTRQCSQSLINAQQLTQLNIEKWLAGPLAMDAPTEPITDSVGSRPKTFDSVVRPPIADLQMVRNVRSEKNITNTFSFVSKEIELQYNLIKRKNNFARRMGILLKPENYLRNVTIEKGLIEQPWDHFDSNNLNRFQQNFFANEIFGRGGKTGENDSPNFLYINGEQSANPNALAISNLAVLKYAKEVKANVYMLEHRYYGRSTLNTTSLEYLTSSQMLYDIARFISVMKRDRNLTGPWIAFGGSYAGSLSAWSRLWWPELITGAIASSAPLQAETHFFDYARVVERVIREHSTACAERIECAFTELRKLTFDERGRRKIAKVFNLENPWNANQTTNIQNFFGSLYGIFYSAVQYSFPFVPMNLAAVCSIMENRQRYPDSIAALAKLARMANHEDTSNDAYPELNIKSMQHKWHYLDGKTNKFGKEPFTDEELTGLHWLWQTCNEFGFYQTSTYGSSIFSYPVPLNTFISLCEQVFGITMDRVERGVARTNYLYGGKKRFSATNVVLTNGRNDPWHALSITKPDANLDPSVVPILIEGTAHCADLMPVREDDSEQLKSAREVVLSNIKKWIEDSKKNGREAECLRGSNASIQRARLA